ncbi:hypothetical protein ACWD7C_36345 [Streptomyces sp. NPDC005134]
MRSYACAQNLGLRDHQCDATAVRTDPSGARAYVLLDGVGDREYVREWTRTAARRLARAAARHGNAETALRAVYGAYAAERADTDPCAQRFHPKAAAIVAVTAPGKPVTIAWCGDSRAYVLVRDSIRCLTSPTTTTCGASTRPATECPAATAAASRRVSGRHAPMRKSAPCPVTRPSSP